MCLKAITWPRVMFISIALATWPVWRWYALRMVDGSDEPFGLLALLTVVAIAMRNGRRLPKDEKSYVGAAVLLLIYIGTFHAISPLPRAIMILAAFGTIWFKTRATGYWGLLALSLPVVATVQFYLGYPLRLCAAEGSVKMLCALNYPVTREGSLLHWHGETIMVDAPCSGVHMLWVGLYLGCTLAAWNQINFPRTLLILMLTVIVVVGANILRATMLFFKEAHIVELPDWTHAAIGVLCFMGAVFIIIKIAQTTEGKPCIP